MPEFFIVLLIFTVFAFLYRKFSVKQASVLVENTKRKSEREAEIKELERIRETGRQVRYQREYYNRTPKATKTINTVLPESKSRNDDDSLINTALAIAITSNFSDTSSSSYDSGSSSDYSSGSDSSSGSDYSGGGGDFSGGGSSGEY